MRITRDSLLKIARETADAYARRERDVVCIYLTGSLLQETPMIGGAADIDLVVVHSNDPVVEREVVSINEDISLDIQHHSQARYQHPRELRLDPWVGSALNENPQALFAIQHWFERTQAGAAAQFTQPENILGRAQPFVTSARQTWMALKTGKIPTGLHFAQGYLSVLGQAGTAIACLTGAPLPERRFMLDLPERFDQLGQPDLMDSFVDLLMPENPGADLMKVWLQGWDESFSALAEDARPPKYHACRHAYYANAIGVLADDQTPASIWLLMNSWLEMTERLPMKDKSASACLSACASLGYLPGRVDDLDAWLDSVDLLLEGWMHANGL